MTDTMTHAHDVVPWPHSGPITTEGHDDGSTIDVEPGAEHIHFDAERSGPDYRKLYLEERELRLSYEGDVAMLKSETRRLEEENNRLKTAPLDPDDPRLIALSVKCARIANNADMCPVYDLFAHGVGLKDRRWLETHGYVTAAHGDEFFGTRK